VFEPKTAEELFVYSALLAAGTKLHSRGVATMILTKTRLF
jgi:hypothetical protein